MSEVISFDEWAEASGWTKAEAADKIADLLYHPTEPLSMRGVCGRLGLDSDSVHRALLDLGFPPTLWTPEDLVFEADHAVMSRR